MQKGIELKIYLIEHTQEEKTSCDIANPFINNSSRQDSIQIMQISKRINVPLYILLIVMCWHLSDTLCDTSRRILYLTF